MGLGKYVHYTFDLVLISMVLAGVKKSTGLTLSTSRLSVSNDFRGLLRKYLSFGEGLFDRLISFCRNSYYFKFKKIENVDDLKDRIRRGVDDFIDDSTRK